MISEMSGLKLSRTANPNIVVPSTLAQDVVSIARVMIPLLGHSPRFCCLLPLFRPVQGLKSPPQSLLGFYWFRLGTEVGDSFHR
jgi:hypothetical protein